MGCPGEPPLISLISLPPQAKDRTHSPRTEFGPLGGEKGKVGGVSFLAWRKLKKRLLRLPYQYFNSVRRLRMLVESSAIEHPP